MNNRKIIDYLFDKMENNENNENKMSIFAFTEEGEIEHTLPNEKFHLEIMFKNNMLAWCIAGYKFEEKHRKAIVAFINLHNNQDEVKYQLYIKGNKLALLNVEQVTDDQTAMAIIDEAIEFFTNDNELTTAVSSLLTNAKVRQNTIRLRVDNLKTRACVYDNQGEHKKAKRCYYEICQYYGYGHMELIALLYSKGKDSPWGKFPINKEYQLEYQMMAVDKDKTNVFAPIVAYNIAHSLNKTELCEQIIAIGQERGSWNAIALNTDNQQTILKRIANCYRKGIGCESNERHANYYDRLLAGERQAVFKDMLLDGFEPVFELMNSQYYYKINSLDELNGLGDEFKRKFLYGDTISEFKLPKWFVPMVNDLPEIERELVLKEAKNKLEFSINKFSSKLESSELALIAGCDADSGVLLEEDGELKYVYLPKLEELKSSIVADQIKSLTKEFATSMKNLSIND